MSTVNLNSWPGPPMSLYMCVRFYMNNRRWNVLSERNEKRKFELQMVIIDIVFELICDWGHTPMHHAFTISKWTRTKEWIWLGIWMKEEQKEKRQWKMLTLNTINILWLLYHQYECFYFICLSRPTQKT